MQFLGKSQTNDRCIGWLTPTASQQSWVELINKHGLWSKRFLEFLDFSQIGFKRGKYNCFWVFGTFRFVGGRVQFVLSTSINTAVAACFCHPNSFVSYKQFLSLYYSWFDWTNMSVEIRKNLNYAKGASFVTEASFITEGEWVMCYWYFFIICSACIFFYLCSMYFRYMVILVIWFLGWVLHVVSDFTVFGGYLATFVNIEGRLAYQWI